MTEVLTANAEVILVFDVVRNKASREGEAYVHRALEFVHQLALALELLLLLFNLFVTLLAYENFGFAPARVALGKNFLAFGRNKLDLGRIEFGVVTRRSPELEFSSKTSLRRLALLFVAA